MLAAGDAGAAKQLGTLMDARFLGGRPAALHEEGLELLLNRVGLIIEHKSACRVERLKHLASGLGMVLLAVGWG